ETIASEVESPLDVAVSHEFDGLGDCTVERVATRCAATRTRMGGLRGVRPASPNAEPTRHTARPVPLPAGSRPDLFEAKRVVGQAHKRARPNGRSRSAHQTSRSGRPSEDP